MIGVFTTATFIVASLLLLIFTEEKCMGVYAIGFLIWGMQYLFDISSLLSSFFSLCGSFFIMLSLVLCVKGGGKW